MSTTVNNFPCELESRHSLRRFLFDLEAEPCLFGADQLAERLIALDELDIILGDLEMEAFTGQEHSGPGARAREFGARLEAANEELYELARTEIVVERSARTLRRWLADPLGAGESERSRKGLGFDLRDEIVSGVLQLREPGEPRDPRLPEMVPYQPTPVRHILDLIVASDLSEHDILIDIGSGLGHVPLLVSILCGIPTRGVEIQPTYVASAQQCAQDLHLSHTHFFAQDGRMADLSDGTVFYLFSPFTGSILVDMLELLRKEGAGRQIKVCSLGPCTRVLKEQAWLMPSSQPDTETITVFTSR